MSDSEINEDDDYEQEEVEIMDENIGSEAEDNGEEYKEL